MKANKILLAVTAGIVLSSAVPVLAAQSRGTSTAGFQNYDHDNDRSVRRQRSRGNDAAPVRTAAHPQAAATPSRRFAEQRPRVVERTPRRPVARAPEPVRPARVAHQRKHFPVAPPYAMRRASIDRPFVVQRPVYVERPVVVHRRVVVEQPVYVDRPVYVDQPIYTESPYPSYNDETSDDTNLLGILGIAILGAMLANQLGGAENGSATTDAGAVLGGMGGSGM
jgi:hypothetical protein